MRGRDTRSVDGCTVTRLCPGSPGLSSVSFPVTVQCTVSHLRRSPVCAPDGAAEWREPDKGVDILPPLVVSKEDSNGTSKFLNYHNIEILSRTANHLSVIYNQ